MMSQQNTSQASKFEHEATLLRNQGKGYEAAEKYQQAKDLYEKSDEPAKAAGCQHMIGVSYKIENDLEQALPALDQAAKLYEAAGDKVGPGRVWRDFGVMYEYHGILDEAEDYLRQAKEVLENAPPESYERNAELGITLAKLGMLNTKLEQFVEAEQNLVDGLSLIRKVGHTFYEITALLHLGELYFATKHYGRMLANLEAALGLIYEHGLDKEHTRRLAQIRGLIAHGYLHCGNQESARHFARKSLDGIAALSKTAQEPLLQDVRAEKLQKLVAV